MNNTPIDLTEAFEKCYKFYPDTKYRAKNPLIHNASDAGKCMRQQTYKQLGYPQSNPTDFVGSFKMDFGNWIESGIKWKIIPRLWPQGIVKKDVQGDAGELETFYGTSWHGYRDFDLIKLEADGTFKTVIVELKTKIGYGATMFLNQLRDDPRVDMTWGYPQQISLYLRNAYLSTKDNKHPVTDGVLLFFLFDKIGGYYQFDCKYQPETDTVLFYKGHSAQYPQYDRDFNHVVKLEDIAKRWYAIDSYIKAKELAPPEFERRYVLDDPRVKESTKKDLMAASKNEMLLGDMQCKYCGFKDKCASDLGVNLNYSVSEIAKIKGILRDL